MTELKTLNDIERRDIVVAQNTGGLVDSIKLRQEAIKWIKELEEMNDFDRLQDLDLDNTPEDWIKHFFNITDKDLEEQGE